MEREPFEGGSFVDGVDAHGGEGSEGRAPGIESRPIPSIPPLPPLSGTGAGSNNWVIAGWRTASGKPLLANDMHLLLSIPAIWYENHLYDGECNLSGVTFPGVPGIVAGQNGHVAWGFTNGFPDVQDLYVEHLRPTEDGRVQYEYRGEWIDAQVRHETIRVKGGETATHEVISTRHGPIINELTSELTEEEPLALRWTSLEPDTMIHCLRHLNCARNCLEVRDALRLWTSPVQNVVYADTEGNIGYSFPGKVPIRAKGDGRLPVPGWTGEYEWTGYIPYDELPHLYNPPEGFIVSANNRVVADVRYDWGRDHCSGDRAQRIVEMIEERDGQRLDVSDMRHMQFDQVSPTARRIGAHLGRLETNDPVLVKAVELMRGWDGSLAGGSPAAAIYEVFIRNLLQRVLSPKLGELTERYMGKGPNPLLAAASLHGQRALEWLMEMLGSPDPFWFGEPATQGRDQAMLASLRAALSYLEEAQGSQMERWSWGDLHALTFEHTLGQVAALKRAFSRGAYPVGGDASTVWATGSAYDNLAPGPMTGPPFRFIADLGDPGRSLGLLAPGQSGQPGSPHYDDRLEAWFDADYHPLPLARRDVDMVTEARLVLLPQPA